MRTNNNSFVLRTAIDRARATHRPYFVTFIDLKNAFPSTNVPLLWAKMYKQGAAGPLFDWLRMLYARMAYVVRGKDGMVDMTNAFKSLVRLLTGDSASPILWNVYFADIKAAIRKHSGDIVLNGMTFLHAEQADDVVVGATRYADLQEKLDDFHGWCTRNFMTVSVAKCESMVWGGPSALASAAGLTIAGGSLKLAEKYKYVGVTFSGGNGDYFRLHFDIKSKKARRVLNVMFLLEKHIGRLSVPNAMTLYMAHVDPHLTSACEVALDITKVHVSKLESVQHDFLRRALGLSSHCALAPMFTETGMTPIRYRRVLIAICYVVYALAQDGGSLPGAAIRESFALDAEGKRSHIGDLRKALTLLPVPIMDVDICQRLFEEPQKCDALTKRILMACKEFLERRIRDSKTLQVLAAWHAFSPPFSPASLRTQIRPFLTLSNTSYRRAVMRLVCGDHPLGIVRMRWATGAEVRIPRSARLCRLCEEAVEDEVHAILGCKSPQLRGCRAEFWDMVEIKGIVPNGCSRTGQASMGTLVRLLDDKQVVSHFAKLVYNCFEVYQSVLQFAPSAELIDKCLRDESGSRANSPVASTPIDDGRGSEDDSDDDSGFMDTALG